MKIGVPTEIKPSENRVGMVPAGVDILTKDGHEVAIQKGAGLGSNITDEEFVAAGVQTLAPAPSTVFGADGVSFAIPAGLNGSAIAWAPATRNIGFLESRLGHLGKTGSPPQDSPISASLTSVGNRGN